jgi:hypothetical protein
MPMNLKKTLLMPLIAFMALSLLAYFSYETVSGRIVEHTKQTFDKSLEDALFSNNSKGSNATNDEESVKFFIKQYNKNVFVEDNFLSLIAVKTMRVSMINTAEPAKSPQVVITQVGLIFEPMYESFELLKNGESRKFDVEISVVINFIPLIALLVMLAYMGWLLRLEL